MCGITAVFSPNGDGNQDALTITGQVSEAVTHRLSILKDGTEVYASAWSSASSNEYAATWDGTAGGSTADDGTYQFVVTARDGWGNPIIFVPASGQLPFRTGLQDTTLKRYLKAGVPIDSTVDSLVILAIAKDLAGNVDTARRRVDLVTGSAPISSSRPRRCAPSSRRSSWCPVSWYGMPRPPPTSTRRSVKPASLASVRPSATTSRAWAASAAASRTFEAPKACTPRSSR